MMLSARRLARSLVQHPWCGRGAGGAGARAIPECFVAARPTGLARGVSAGRALATSPAPAAQASRPIHPWVAKKVQKLMATAPVHELDKKAEASGYEVPWGFVGAAVVERLPLITPELEGVELEFVTKQQALHQKSAKVYPKEFYQTDMQNEEDDVPAKDKLEANSGPPRVTEADLANDTKSTNRALAHRLYLVVRHRDTQEWGFPTEWYHPEGKLREAAQAAVEDFLGQELGVFWIGDAPMTCHKYELSEKEKKSRATFGVKMFFYRGQFVDGHVRLDTSVYTEYKWLKRDELPSHLPKPLADAILPALPSWH